MSSAKLSVFALLACSAAFGQTATVPGAATASALPTSWIVGTGVEYNTYGITPAWVPFIHVMGCWTGWCEISTLEMPSGAEGATLRQDVGYKLQSSADGSSMLIAIVGGSITTQTNTTVTPATPTVTSSLLQSSVLLGGLGGGFAARVDPGIIPWFKAIKGKGISVWGEFREASVTSVGVKPQFAAALNYRWK